MPKEPPPRRGCVATLFRAMIVQLGWFALVFLILAMTPVPWRVLGWLGSDPRPLQGPPDAIVMLGGGGIPSESGLMRAYETARIAALHPKAQVILAMPHEPDEKPGVPGSVARELILRGVSASRLRQEGEGRHTREQATKLLAMLGDKGADLTVLVVTSPEHLRRSLLTFRKAGFRHAHGAGVFSESIEADLRVPPGGEGRKWVPSVGGSLLLRYRIWDNLELQVRILRELTALLYYQAKGWI